MGVRRIENVFAPYELGTIQGMLVGIFVNRGEKAMS
jgi:hypothetical protein